MKLMEQVCQVLRVRHYSLATERCYCQWIRRFIFFHGVKHPNSMGAEEVAVLDCTNITWATKKRLLRSDDRVKTN